VRENPNSKHIPLSLWRLLGNESSLYLKKSSNQLVKLLTEFEVTHLEEALGLKIEKTSIHKVLIASLCSAIQSSYFLKSQLNVLQSHQ
jgi:hypothetical protein